MSALTKALVAAQKSMPELQRDKINPHLNSQYISLERLLEEVLPVLNTHGLALLQFPTYVETESGRQPALRYALVHGESGESMEDTMLLVVERQSSQGLGSAITYARRYTLMALLGLSADEDDDGNKSTAKRTRAAQANGKITPKQRNDLMAEIRKAGVPTDRAREIVKEIADVEESKDIPAAKYEAVIGAIRKEGSR